MPCYFPLKAWKVRSKKADKGFSISFKMNTSDFPNPELHLPCGQCIGCRLEKSRQWAVRCIHEASLYENNCFVTLTYDQKNLPQNNSLDKTAFPLFMKRLRKKYGPGIRYFQCGEYGESTQRPHHHAIIFNHDFEDKKWFSETNKIPLYTSESLSSAWQQGFATVGSATFESAGYVARYALKKVTGKNAPLHYSGRTPEFATMSRGSKRLGTGGIGRGWLTKYHSDVYPLDRVVVRGLDTRPPRYYDKLHADLDRSSMEQIKLNREKNSIKFVESMDSDGKISLVSDSSDTRLAVKEICKQAELKTLKRQLEL